MSHALQNDRVEPRWRRLPGERPRQIIEAAVEIFGERGLAAARLEDIARRAGVSKGTIYLYFPNKEALFTEMIREMVISQIERAEHEYAGGDPEQQLRAYYRGLWQNLSSPIFETIHRLMMFELKNFPQLAEWYVREVIARALNLASSIISRGIALGQFRRTDPDVAARLGHSVFVTNAVWAANHDQFSVVAGDPKDVLDQMIDFVLHALKADTTSSESDATGAGSRE